MVGGVHTSEVIMRKRSENRGYADENIRDSIVMGEVSSNFSDLSKLETSAVFLNVFLSKCERTWLCLSGQ